MAFYKNLIGFKTMGLKEIDIRVSRTGKQLDLQDSGMLIKVVISLKLKFV